MLTEPKHHAPNDFGSPSCAAAQPVAEYRRLHPGQSTDAFVLHHPEAKYFNV
jgi:hypothetical protein